MSLLRHVLRCNSWRPERFVPLWCGEARVGLIRRDNAEALRRFSDVFSVEPDGVWLIAPGDLDAVSAAVDQVIERLVIRLADGRSHLLGDVVRFGTDFFIEDSRLNAAADLVERFGVSLFVV